MHAGGRGCTGTAPLHPGKHRRARYAVIRKASTVPGLFLHDKENQALLDRNKANRCRLPSEKDKKRVRHGMDMPRWDVHEHGCSSHTSNLLHHPRQTVCKCGHMSAVASGKPHGARHLHQTVIPFVICIHPRPTRISGLTAQRATCKWGSPLMHGTRPPRLTGC